MSDSIHDSKPTDTILWERLAKLLYTEEGCETAMLMQQSKLLKSETCINIDNPFKQKSTAPPTPRAIGPWIPRKNGEFVRESKWDKYLWLEERDVLSPKKNEGTYRICLVGESVAAGMFFSPNISPAKILSSIVNQSKPANAKQAEVIDLTRNAMRVELLVDIVDAASQLNPDIIVVFAGNNFCRNHTIGRPDQQNVSNKQLQIANEQGAIGLVNYFTEELAQATKRIIDTLGKNARRHSTKIIWLIPTTHERWQRLAPVHWLGGQKTKKWHNLLTSALHNLELSNYKKVLELARTMEQLDKRTCPTTQRLIATALNHLGQREESKKHCQYEVDIDCALERNSFLSPGIQTVVKTIISEGGKRHGFKCIDLQKVFSEHINPRNTTSDLFVDYCHLSLEGMEVAMSAVAAEISEMPLDCWKSVFQRSCSFAIEPKYIARGLFEATIYTSHMQHSLEEKDNVSHLRQRFYHALTLWDGLAETMTEYVRMRHGAVTTEVSKDTHKIVASANSLLDYGILQWIHGIDSQTIEAICGALDDAGHNGSALLSYYQAYDKKKLNHGIDLTNPRYIKYFGRDGEVNWDPERGTYRTQPYLRAYWPQLPLVFVSERDTLLDCYITSRLPKEGANKRCGTLKITVNDELMANLQITHVWSRQHFKISAEHTRDGFNDIQLEWPDLLDDDTPAIDDAIRKLQTFGRANWHPVFGEVFSFRIAPH